MLMTDKEFKSDIMADTTNNKGGVNLDKAEEMWGRLMLGVKDQI